MTMRTFGNSDEIFEYLLNFVNVEKGQKTEFKLDRMRSLCSALGNPESAYPTIHVAGSKGKGSVSTMTARILEASGRRVGLYTSPHLLRWKERISLAGTEMPEAILLRAMDELMPLVDGKGPADFVGDELPTYFELTTLLGFLAFRLAGCDAAVIETGLGGRLDSTNVVASAASVITPIELEHTEWLGDTIAKIAFEKAGIIKPGRPCIVSRQKPEARAVFRDTCAERGSPLREVESLVAVEELVIDRSGTRAGLRFLEGRPFAETLHVRTPLIGTVQAENMALALLAAAEIEPSLSPEAAAEGLARASLPARFEILKLAPPVVLDGAHTPNSVRLCLESFEALFPGPKALLFACAVDKHHEELAAILAKRFGSVIVTKPGTFKESAPDIVERSFRAAGAESRLIVDTAEAIRTARAEAAEAGIPLLVTGSFYLCAEAAALLAKA
ncbi:MAG: hypothetical protein JNG85_11585 [Spirochaetaceae bacterium]|nr:hypothetical protein [Spirochaetaceae bacterium]